MKEIIEEQLKLHKNINLQDIYKLLYQAEFGLHAHDVQKMVREEYSKACRGKGWVKKEPILEKISEDYYRLNLRSYMLGLNNDTVLTLAALDSRELSKGTKEGLKKRWEGFKRLNLEIKLFPKGEIKNFEKTLRRYDFPAAHHTINYNKDNDPCYIVLHKKAIKFWYKEKWL